MFEGFIYYLFFFLFSVFIFSFSDIIIKLYIGTDMIRFIIGITTVILVTILLVWSWLNSNITLEQMEKIIKLIDLGVKVNDIPRIDETLINLKEELSKKGIKVT